MLGFLPTTCSAACLMAWPQIEGHVSVDNTEKPFGHKSIIVYALGTVTTQVSMCAWCLCPPRYLCAPVCTAFWMLVLFTHTSCTVMALWSAHKCIISLTWTGWGQASGAGDLPQRRHPFIARLPLPTLCIRNMPWRRSALPSSDPFIGSMACQLAISDFPFT